jgi:hypothetical protein
MDSKPQNPPPWGRGTIRRMVEGHVQKHAKRLAGSSPPTSATKMVPLWLRHACGSPVSGSILAAFALLTATPAVAQNVVVSSPAENVSLTVYRAPWRGETPINKNWPQGYALITETRTINIPAGESVVRFEGVSEGLFPETAIVTGLPKGVKEKNRDARLLSPAGLVDAYLKRQVKLTRTDKATGKTVEETALVTAGPNGGVILQTDAGYEALRCTGLPERMRYGGVPKDLSAKPTLSVITTSDRAVTATVTLTYMAAGFDWQASYVMNAGEFAADHKLDLNVFAWLTIANGGNQSFANANLMAVAGKPNRVGNAALPKSPPPALTLKCWPMQRTHEVPEYFPYGDFPVEEPYLEQDAKMYRMEAVAMMAPPSPVMAAPPAPAIVATQEELGDLKLYRVPERVTVNAKGQKQVAMLVQPKSKFRRVYRASPLSLYGYSQQTPLIPMLIGKNEKVDGLGLPLPSGTGMVFENSTYGSQLVGEIKVKDRAVGDEIELALPATSAVQVAANRLTQDKNGADYKLRLSNANPYAISAEITLPVTVRNMPTGVRKKDGNPVWYVTVPANDSAELQVNVPNR